MDIGTIAQALGFESWGAAQASLQRGMRAHRSFMEDTDPADMRAFEIARCDWEISQFQKVIRDPGFRVAPNGKPIVNQATGEYLPDWDVYIKAMLAYDKIADRMVKLKGLYPEKQAPVSVVPVTHIVQGIAVDVLR